MSPEYKPRTIAAQAQAQDQAQDHASPPKRGAAAGGVAGEIGAAWRHAIVPPIDITATYERDADNLYASGYCYARSDNATTRQAEAVIAALDGGASAMLLGSGMAAATTAFLALARPAHVVAPRVMYWSLRKWLLEDAHSHGITVNFADASDLDALRAAIRPGHTRMIWVETPANPLWNITDIAATAELAHDAGAMLGVDATVASPVLTRPLQLGADVVMHSATKYLNGHSDVLAGALVFARDDSAYAAEAQRLRGSLGTILGPFEAALLLRGMRSLHLRVDFQCRSALAIARHFDGHPAIAAVLYPGLESHPGHDIAKRQMSGGFSGMASLRVKGGAAAAIKTAANVRLWRRATSLGGPESLIEHRASIEGPGTPCPDDLLRLSVGLEDSGDLIADLERALAIAVT